MKKFNVAVVSGVISMSLLLSNTLLAHTGLSKAVPADGAVVNESPQALDLTFSEDVRLLKVSLTGEENGVVDIGFTPSAQAASQFAVAIPGLEEDSYTVNWTILGSDSHRVEDNFSFTVDPAATEVTDPSDGSHADHQGSH